MDKVIILFILFLFPSVIFATNLASVANKILDFLAIFPKLFFAIALAYFMYGLSGYTTGLDDKKKREAKTIIINGLIGLFVMSSIVGIISLIKGMLDI